MSLFSSEDKNFGWTFGNGPEFPGATGKLEAEKTDKACLRLEGDFSKGGNYVEALRKVRLDLSEISFDIKYPDHEAVTLRVGDGSGQCHQVNLALRKSPDWQTIRFPIASFLAEKGNSSAAEIVRKYENWGGANDAKWHSPCAYITVGAGPGSQGRDKPVTLWLADVKVRVKDKSVAIKKSVRLDEFGDDELDWGFSNGQEFPGATGKLELAKDAVAAGKSAMKLSGDFTKGGAYVAATRNLDGVNAVAIKFKVKTDNTTAFSIRLDDSTGQCHQRKGYKLQTDGQWHEFSLAPTQIAGQEHWGGANDGKWHAPAKSLTFVLGKGSSKDNLPAVSFGDIYLEAEVEASMQAASFKADFESGAVPPEWKTQGKVFADKAEPFKGEGCLSLERTQENMETPTGAVTNAFAVKEGVWEIAAAAKASVYSPDTSYNGAVRLVLADAGGKVLDNIEVGIFTANKWEAIKKRVDLPKGVTTARFEIQLNKTYGKFSVDELSASYLAPSARANAAVAALKFSSKVLGNMFKPEDKVALDITAECTRPLPEQCREVVCVLRDYWGAEFSEPIKVKLEKATGGAGGKKAYKGSLDLSGLKLEQGKYYEVHGSVAEPELAEPYTDKSTFVILPEAVTKKYRPTEIPFTSRDWDDRIKEYFFLSDRLGLRFCCLWSGWNAKPPYEVHAPGIEWCKELGMGAVLGTPGNMIEYHQGNYKDYNETALREGAKNLVNKYKDYVPIYVNLGNEPHAADDARAQEMVAAYKAMYEGAKAADPNVLVIGTSCGADEIYFKNGFHQYLDVFDFHAYDDANSIKGEESEIQGEALHEVQLRQTNLVHRTKASTARA